MTPDGSASDVRTKVYANTGNAPLLRAISHAPPLRILDLGCGRGDNARMLSSLGHEVHGLTISAAEATEAAAWCAHVVVHDLEHGLPSLPAESYDLCIASHVLEHLRWPERVVADLPHVLKGPTAELLVALPNIMHYRHRIPLAMGYFEYQPIGVMDASHFRWFTFASGRRLLEQAGFEVTRAWGEGSFPLFPLRRVLPRSVSSLVDSAATRLVPGLFAGQLLYSARPRIESLVVVRPIPTGEQVSGRGSRD